ncbi:MAG: hypothetical protein N4A33_03420 [Bacteriovoracaceae bacterium]|jgi:hypothetical protein|nr:hypothetical protein [Bacteriovoracaceae bacterium]
MKTLVGHHSNSLSHKPQININELDDWIEINLEVKIDKLNFNPQFSKVDIKKNIGLWDYDVFEAFLTFEDSSYLEIQTSPKDQIFSYLIKSPRKDYDFPNSLELKAQNHFNDGIWTSKMTVSKESIPGNGKLVGNIFCVLGKDTDRSYYALNINTEDEPDFHRPDLFRSLL